MVTGFAHSKRGVIPVLITKLQYVYCKRMVEGLGTRLSGQVTRLDMNMINAYTFML